MAKRSSRVSTSKSSKSSGSKTPDKPVGLSSRVEDWIRVRGARQHNLKNLNLEIPRDRLIVFTGVSGSGKSSLAFDTIFAEGQRRYVESLSAYARQFLGQVDKPDVDMIEGLSPAIAIDQKSTSHNPRSTVGTVTEIYDYFRLLFGRAGEPHCPHCQRSIVPQTIDQMVDQVLALPDGTRFQILAPLVRGQKGTHQKLLSGLASEGFARVRINGQVQELQAGITLPKNHSHTIEVVIDRLVKKPGLAERLTDSLSTCLKRSGGMAIVAIVPSPDQTVDQPQDRGLPMAGADNPGAPPDLIFSENFACPEHGAVMEELSPRLFSFNSPYGACGHCHGLGSLNRFTAEQVVPDPRLPLYEAIAPWCEKDHFPYWDLLNNISHVHGFHIGMPWFQLSAQQKQVVLYGSKTPVWMETDFDFGHSYVLLPPKGQKREIFYEGVIPILERQYRQSTSEVFKQKLEKYLVNQPCEVCQGKRLKPESLAVRMGSYTITDFTSVDLQDCLERVKALTGEGYPQKPTVPLSDRQLAIGQLVLQEIKARLRFLLDVGLDYLSLDRPAMTLSGGESQRIRLATQIGSGLTGVLYVLDEPSIGLHQRDNQRLLHTLTRLRDLGNTLIVVEHDEDTIRAADYLVDIGPGAGIHGGTIVAQGTLQDVLDSPDSITGAYLSGRQCIQSPSERRSGNGYGLILKNAHRNNLQNLDVTIPLGKLVAITGVSGSGKSTLINELLYPALQHHLGQRVPFPKGLDDLKNVAAVDKVIVIDQSPIGRTPRSNPATYTGTFEPIRDLFSQTIEAKARGYKAGQFSFNVKGGRCEACRGQGVNVIEMNFLPDVYVQCEVCKGARYTREVLQVKYKGKSIADVLEMTVEEACGFFDAIPQAVTRLQTLVDVGLGYVHLGQSAPTLSGGEAQRVKLATELSRRATGKTLYLIDEPTTGLSFYDVHKLLEVMQRLVDKGNSIVVIEHNLDVIRCSDWIIDLGPEGGHRGGTIVAQGTPEDVSQSPESYTGQYLAPLLRKQR